MRWHNSSKTHSSGIPTIDSVQAEVMESRDLALAATTIMACIAMAPKVIDDATRIVNSIKSLVQASSGLRSAIFENPRPQNPRRQTAAL